jgi:2-keto-4-pentenoate hydratase/2-oxohepta-3-ene-1,7-dioic acid hydratase in catechol pathway
VNDLPIPRPGKIVAIGLNYRDHAKESGGETPTSPVVFAKFPSSMIADGEPILIPRGCDRVDYEAELAVVIGRQAREVTVADALDHVHAYTALNDVSDRQAQFADGQFVRAKSYDSFTPIGPRLVPRDEIPDPQRLAIRCWLNGDLVQDGNTADMVFGVAELIAFLSRTITLERGDVIATGTPAGVGVFRQPPLFLRPGDEVTVDIEGIGRLTNPVRERVPR